MRHSTSLLALALGALLPTTQAQIGYDAKTNSFLCPIPGGHYCTGGSLKSANVISCTDGESAEIRSCNVELSHILPEGYDRFAVCYESSPESGDAICAFNGTGYIFTGSKVDIPETILCESIPLIPHPNADGVDQAISSKTSTVLPTSRTSPTHTPPTSSPATAPACSNPWSRIGTADPLDGPLLMQIIFVIPTPSVPVPVYSGESSAGLPVSRSSASPGSRPVIGPAGGRWGTTPALATTISVSSTITAATPDSSDLMTTLTGSVPPRTTLVNGASAVEIGKAFIGVCVLLALIGIFLYCV